MAKPVAYWVLAAHGDRHCVPHEQDWEVLESVAMKAKYDRDTDTLTLILKGVAVWESDEDKPGGILDYDSDGNLVSIEVLDASRRVDAANKIELEMTS